MRGTFEQLRFGQCHCAVFKCKRRVIGKLYDFDAVSLCGRGERRTHIVIGFAYSGRQIQPFDVRPRRQLVECVDMPHVIMRRQIAVELRVI